MDKIFKVTFSDDSVTEYTAEDLGLALATEPRLAIKLELWDGKQYLNCLKEAGDAKV